MLCYASSSVDEPVFLNFLKIVFYFNNNYIHIYRQRESREISGLYIYRQRESREISGHTLWKKASTDARRGELLKK